MVTDGLIIALVFSGVLALLAYKKNSLPIMFVSSVGWTICALQIYQQLEEILPMALLLMLAASQFLIVTRGED